MSPTEAKPLDKRRGRRSAEEENQIRSERERARSAVVRKSARDIHPIPTDTIEWDRRLAGAESLERFGKSYMPTVFNLSMSDDHYVCVKKMEQVIRQGGMFSLAMPRGQGKTSWCLCATIWATLYAYRQFVMFIGSMEDQATKLLDAIKQHLYNSPTLQQDFPEVAYPLLRLENRYHLASGQLHRERSTSIEWGSKQLRYGSVLLDHTEARPYLENDPHFLVTVGDEKWMPRNTGAIIHAAGIGGSFRGEVRTHPITLEQVRPDVVLLDDVQKDQGAESPMRCEKLIKVIDGAIKGLAGPRTKIAAIMPTTVIRPGDVSDTYLDRERKPEWRGERCKMVTQWPDGITDHRIDPATVPGSLWLKYAELRRESFQRHEDDRLAMAFYEEQKDLLMVGFNVAWEERYLPDEPNAQVHAMNLRFESPETFASEYQNNPVSHSTEDTSMPSAEELAERTNGLVRGALPGYADHVVAMVDVQDEILFWTVYAGGSDFTGSFVDYGVWPNVPNTRYFRKTQTSGWKLLTHRFFQAHPEVKPTKESRKQGAVAPFESKIYYALQQCTQMLLNRTFTKSDGGELRITRLAIDARWGKSSDTVRRFIVESRRPEILPYFGQYVGPDAKQFEEYTRTKGWRFENQRHHSMRECRWILRLGQDGYYYLAVDVNRFKSFLMNRLTCPRGSPGAITLYNESPEHHSMFADHICRSEFPEPLAARGRIKDIWKVRDHRPDNDWLDTSVGCMALSSYEGACIREETGETQALAPKKTLSELWKEKHR